MAGTGFEDGHGLLTAITENNLDAALSALHLGIDLNKPVENENGINTLPISLACARGCVDIVKHLLKVGVELNIPGQDGKLPIHFACDGDERHDDRNEEYSEILRLLIAAGVDINAVDNMGRTPIFLACEADDVSAVKLLVQGGCDVNLQTVSGDSPMKVACRNAKYWSYWHGRESSSHEFHHLDPHSFPPIQITKLLLQADADITEATLLPTIVHFGNIKLVKELLDLGMDINMLDDNMCTPLGQACSLTNVSPDLVKMLLSHGADVNKGGGWKKQKPLIFAYVHNSVDKIRLLLSYGAVLYLEEVTELVSLSLSKFVLENPEVIGPTSKELASWRLLIAAGFNPCVQGTELAFKVQQLSMCSSYDKISPWIQSMLFPLRSLKACCRISIREALQMPKDEKIQLLPLPDSLKSYLSFKEFSSGDQSS